MWRSTMFLSRTLLAARYGQKLLPQLIAAPVHIFRPPSTLFSTKQQETNRRNSTNSIIINDEEHDKMSYTEAKKLLRLVNLEALKRNLGVEEKEVIDYMELLKACEVMGITRSSDEAIKFSHILDEAGVVLLFRNKVYLHPHKVADLVSKVVPLDLTAESDPRKEELKVLLKKKEEIDMLAHRYVRRVLWAGLGFLLVQLSLFFRLTFWEFSWDVMEPITFFTTMTGLIIGYTYFLVTSSDPTYQDMMKRLFLSRQRKLIKKCNFDLDRLSELQKIYKCPPDCFERMGLS